MTNGKMTSQVENGKTLLLERVFDAPPALTFKMFKEAEHLKEWWGPRGWKTPVCEVDFRQGGTWIYCMKCVDPAQGDFFGMEAWGKGVYQEIDEPRKLIYVDYFTDENGKIKDDMPSTKTTFEFLSQDGRTKLMNRSEYVSEEALKTVLDMGMLQGVTETWDRLEEHLAVVKNKN